MKKRAQGILLHPVCLPGGIEPVGTLGEGALDFIGWMKAAGQRVWQVLPLGPTGYGDSPYSSFSAFAGNPYLVDLAMLAAAGDLEGGEAGSMKTGDPGRIDYGQLYAEKTALLERAARRFFEGGARDRQKAFRKFCVAEEDWLHDYALFMAAKKEAGGGPWQEWPAGVRTRRDREALERLAGTEEYRTQCYVQWQFDAQWRSVRAAAKKAGIRIIGDAPIFVASDSADVWARQDLFEVDEGGRSIAVAGVPPDYFSATGQLWGNPLYRWEKMADDGYGWWRARLRRLLRLVDDVRIDHFRGFAQYWEVPADAKTAVEGRWVDGPGADFFGALRKEFGRSLPVIAEDLGLITPDVVELRERFGLPGMRIFCFAPWGEEKWGDGENGPRPFDEHPYVPRNYEKNAVAYPGTHDNDTFVGWYGALGEKERGHLVRYLGASDDAGEVLWRTLELLAESAADLVVVQMQDVLGLDGSARLNLPGSCDGKNWTWRLSGLPDEATTKRLAALARKTNR